MMDKTMNTIVSDWKIVSVMDDNELVGKVIYATVVDDMTCRFFKGDYVCTSSIESISIKSQMIFTESGSIYQLIGNGSKAKIDMKDFELLRNGFSPEMINQLNLAPNDYFH